MTSLGLIVGGFSALGRWLGVNGEAIYGAHNWITWREDGGRGEHTPDVRYTVKNGTLFAIGRPATPDDEQGR